MVSIWGGSHEPAIGVDITGLPIGTEIDMKELRSFMARRAPGNSPFATKRKEPDIPLPTAGLTAMPNQDEDILTVTDEKVSFEIRNTNTRSADYKSLRSVPRPGHADYTARMRYGNELNMAGGGPFSARMTAPLCIAGGIAMQMLARQNIQIGAHIYAVGGITDTPFDPVNVIRPAASNMTTAARSSAPKNPQISQTSQRPQTQQSAELAEFFNRLKAMDFPVLDEASGESMKALILEARDSLDSVGGIVEACVTGLPAGIGGAMYDGLESSLAPILFGIPAVKGVEFGAGFSAAGMKGSENNDPFYFSNGEVRTRTNNHGGILGGITSGMPLITRLAFKPTPSISREQDSVNLETKENTKLVINGRHDPCVVLRAVPIVEAALAVGILDQLMECNKEKDKEKNNDRIKP